MRINLLPPEIRERRRAEHRLGYVAIAAIIATAVLVGAWGLGFMQLRSAQAQLEAIKKQVQGAQAQADQLAPYEQRANELAQKKATLQEALRDGQDPVELFNEVSLVLPAEAWLTSMNYDGEKVTLSGTVLGAEATGYKNLEKVIVRLNDLPQLEDVWLEAHTPDFESENPAVTFSISARIVPATIVGGEL